MNPPKLPLMVRYGHAETTHHRFQQVGKARVAYEVSDPARSIPKNVTQREFKQLEREQRRQRVRELKART